MKEISKMCGIIGVYYKNKEQNIKEILDSSLILKNRGPDSGRLLSLDNYFLGFRRLSINDTCEKGMQPFTKGSISVICNGEIYNHKYLQEKYNITCRSLSDCECIIHLYEKLGFERTIMELRGDFALIIIDREYMYFGRDRIGVRPLFLGRTKSKNVALASCARALTDYCDKVCPVVPGWGVYNSIKDNLSFMEYKFPISNVPDEKITTLIRTTLTQAVKDRLMSDRPIGCLLSGGLDSSLVVSIICKILGPEKVRTYSIGMEGSIDLEYARVVAEKLGTKHQEVKFTAEEGFKVIPEVIRDLESYDITTVRASVGMWILAKWISENTDDIVIMSGEGADELFCGYLYFHYAPSSNELQKESFRLVKNLHLYDVLRADRCVSSHGLELRVPFLSHEMIDLALSISPDLKKPYMGLEKSILRNAFSENYLPEEVRLRRKDGMSDGISGKGKKWYEHIQNFVKDIISEENYNRNIFPSPEAQYYRMIYDKLFPNYQPLVDYWLPKWVEHGGDPSGRNLQVFDEK